MVFAVHAAFASAGCMAEVGAPEDQSPEGKGELTDFGPTDNGSAGTWATEARTPRWAYEDGVLRIWNEEATLSLTTHGTNRLTIAARGESVSSEIHAVDEEQMAALGNAVEASSEDGEATKPSQGLFIDPGDQWLSAEAQEVVKGLLADMAKMDTYAFVAEGVQHAGPALSWVIEKIEQAGRWLGQLMGSFSGALFGECVAAVSQESVYQASQVIIALTAFPLILLAASLDILSKDSVLAKVAGAILTAAVSVLGVLYYVTLAAGAKAALILFSAFGLIVGAVSAAATLSGRYAPRVQNACR